MVCSFLLKKYSDIKAPSIKHLKYVSATERESDSKTSYDDLEDVEVKTILEMSEDSTKEEFTIQSSSTLKTETPVVHNLSRQKTHSKTNARSEKLGCPANSGIIATGNIKKYIVPPLSKYLQKDASNKPMSSQSNTDNEVSPGLDEAKTPESYIKIPQTSYVVLANPSVDSTFTSTPIDEANGPANYDSCDIIQIQILDPYRLY